LTDSPSLLTQYHCRTFKVSL